MNLKKFKKQSLYGLKSEFPDKEVVPPKYTALDFVLKRSSSDIAYVNAETDTAYESFLINDKYVVKKINEYSTIDMITFKHRNNVFFIRGTNSSAEKILTRITNYDTLDYEVITKYSYINTTFDNYFIDKGGKLSIYSVKNLKMMAEDLEYNTTSKMFFTDKDEYDEVKKKYPGFEELIFLASNKGYNLFLEGEVLLKDNYAEINVPANLEKIKLGSLAPNFFTKNLILQLKDKQNKYSLYDVTNKKFLTQPSTSMYIGMGKYFGRRLQPGDMDENFEIYDENLNYVETVENIIIDGFLFGTTKEKETKIYKENLDKENLLTTLNYKVKNIKHFSADKNSFLVVEKPNEKCQVVDFKDNKIIEQDITNVYKTIFRKEKTILNTIVLISIDYNTKEILFHNIKENKATQIKPPFDFFIGGKDIVELVQNSIIPEDMIEHVFYLNPSVDATFFRIFMQNQVVPKEIFEKLKEKYNVRVAYVETVWESFFKKVNNSKLLRKYMKINNANAFYAQLFNIWRE